MHNRLAPLFKGTPSPLYMLRLLLVAHSFLGFSYFECHLRGFFIAFHLVVLVSTYRSWIHEYFSLGDVSLLLLANMFTRGPPYLFCKRLTHILIVRLTIYHPLSAHCPCYAYLSYYNSLSRARATYSNFALPLLITDLG